MKKIVIYILSISFIFLSSCTGSRTKKLDELPNVVFIVIDTLRSDHLPFYGYSENTAPFLNELAKEGVVFNNTYSASSWTAPATASIFTSLYPFQHRVILNMLATMMFNKNNPDYRIKLNRIPKEIVTLGESFKDKGYATFGFADNVNIGKKEGFDQGFDKFYTFNYKRGKHLNEIVLNHSKEIKKSGKYFVYIHYMDVHQPNHENSDWLMGKEIAKISVKDSGEFNIKKKIKNETLFYDGEINYVDRRIKELFEHFKWKKNTLVIMTADHGEELWDHGRWGHGYSLYKEVTKVPMFFYYSGDKKNYFKKGSAEQNVSTIDILPTLRDFIGLKKDSANEGVSLLKILENGEKEKTNNRFIFSHLFKKRIVSPNVDGFEAYSVINGNYSFIKSLPGQKRMFKLMFFDLKKDPEQKNNIFKTNIVKANKLRSRFIKFYKVCRKFKKDIVNYTSNKKEMEKLKTLGYIDNK